MFKPVMNRRQEELILDHLLNEGSITRVVAESLYKVRDLPRRIHTLREAGFRILSVRLRDHCGQRYVSYRYLGINYPSQDPMFRSFMERVMERVNYEYA